MTGAMRRAFHGSARCLFFYDDAQVDARLRRHALSNFVEARRSAHMRAIPERHHIITSAAPPL